MLEVIVTDISPEDRERASKLAKELAKVNIKFTENYLGGRGDLRFMCPFSLTLTQAQERKFDDILVKGFGYVKTCIWPSKDKVDYGLVSMTSRMRTPIIYYDNFRLYLENMRA